MHKAAAGDFCIITLTPLLEGTGLPLYFAKNYRL